MPPPSKPTKQKKPLKLNVGNNQILLHHGNMLDCTAEAMVCPTNRDLNTESGLARLILDAAGPSSERQKPHTSEPLGKVVVLPGGHLKSKFIFLTVVEGEQNSKKLKTTVRQAVDRAIRYAEFLHLSSLAFPVLGAAHHQPPYDEVAEEISTYVIAYFTKRTSRITPVFFSAYQQQASDALTSEIQDILSH